MFNKLVAAISKNPVAWIGPMTMFVLLVLILPLSLMMNSGLPTIKVDQHLNQVSKLKATIMRDKVDNDLERQSYRAESKRLLFQYEVVLGLWCNTEEGKGHGMCDRG